MVHPSGTAPTKLALHLLLVGILGSQQWGFAHAITADTGGARQLRNIHVPEYEGGSRPHARISDVKRLLAPEAKTDDAGHYLTSSELDNVTAISCLEAKQSNPSVVCEDSTASNASASANATDAQSDGLQPAWEASNGVSAANYPSYKDEVCNSHGEYLCDYQNELTEDERADVAARLKEKREATPVQCGRLLDDPVDQRHYQPFYLGVAVIEDWPLESSTPDSLQQFGQILDGQWNMGDLVVGDPIPRARCPNTGMLLILTKNRQAYLSTDSCEFLCRTQGGPEVVTAVLSALDDNGADAAVKAGIDTVYSILSRPGATTLGTPSYSSSSSSSSESTADDTEEESYRTGYADKETTGTNMIWLQRTLLVLALVILAAALLLGGAVCVMAPGLAKELKR